MLSSPKLALIGIILVTYTTKSATKNLNQPPILLMIDKNHHRNPFLLVWGGHYLLLSSEGVRHRKS